MTKRVRSPDTGAEISFMLKVRGLFLLDNAKKIDISQHQTAATPHEKITTALIWSYDTNVPQTNSKADN